MYTRMSWIMTGMVSLFVVYLVVVLAIAPLIPAAPRALPDTGAASQPGLEPGTGWRPGRTHQDALLMESSRLAVHSPRPAMLITACSAPDAPAGASSTEKYPKIPLNNRKN